MDYAETHQTDWSDAISCMNLVEHTNKAFSTLLKLPKLVMELPDEAFGLDNLTTTHLNTAVGFKGPEDVGQLREFGERRMDILRHVAAHPDDTGQPFIQQRMKALQKEMGVETPRRETIQSLLMKFAQASLMLVNWTDQDFDSFGVTKSQTQEYWDGYRAELVERGAIPQDDTDPIAFCPPWSSKIIEAEETQPVSL